MHRDEDVCVKRDLEPLADLHMNQDPGNKQQNLNGDFSHTVQTLFFRLVVFLVHSQAMDKMVTPFHVQKRIALPVESDFNIGKHSILPRAAGN